MKRGKKEIPVYVFNEHNEAFYYWHRARIEGHLQETLDLFHIDAHDDMGKPSRFKSSIHFHGPSLEAKLDYYERFAHSELSIASFIFPAVLCGLLRNVYFVFPKWRKFKPARKRRSIASAFGEGKDLKYTIKPDAKSNPMVEKAYPDLKQFHYIALEAEKLPKNRKVVLDIDMDFFACRDSTHNHFAYELEITREQFQNKNVLLADKTLPFSGFEFDFFEREGRCFAKIARTKGMDIFHLPPEEEIGCEIDKLVNILIEKGIRPAVVTICRSCDSGYCPEEYSRFIEQRLVEKLKPLLG